MSVHNYNLCYFFILFKSTVRHFDGEQIYVSHAEIL